MAPCIQFRVWEKKTYSPWVTTDSETVFHEESIGKGFKFVTVSFLEKFKKKGKKKKKKKRKKKKENGPSLTKI